MTNQHFNRFAIPLKMGVLIAIIKIALGAAQYHFFANKFLPMIGMMAVSFVAGATLLIVTGILQRRAMGRYIDFKQAFQAIFVAILIFVTLNYFFDLLYFKIIDPALSEKIHQASIATATKMGAPEESLEQINKSYEQQQPNDSLNIADVLLGLLKTIVLYGILGFICAAIVKKDKPVHLAE